MGGTSIKTTLIKLPKAMAYLSGNPFEQAFKLDQATARLINEMARSIPVKREIRRDPARAHVVDKVWNDTTIPPIVRAACAIAYATGARGGNIFLTSYSRKRQHMLIKWSDLEQRQDESGLTYFLLRIRKEKTAKRHRNTFQPIVLARGQPGELCPVEAIAIAGRHAGSISPDTAIFGSVTEKAVCSALNRHALPGERYTSHSLRQGMATDLASTSATDKLIQISGRWGSAESFKPYVRITQQQRSRLNQEIRGDKPAAAPAAAHPPAPAAAHPPAAASAADNRQNEQDGASSAATEAQDHDQIAVVGRCIDLGQDSSSDDDGAPPQPILPRNWPHLRKATDPAIDPTPLVYLPVWADADSYHIYFYDLRTHARARYFDKDKDHVRYSRKTGRAARKGMKLIMARSEPIRAIPGSAADKDIQTLTEMYRESPGGRRTGMLPDRDQPHQEDNESIDYTPPNRRK